MRFDERLAAQKRERSNMLYYREISLKDQRKCLLKNAERADAAAFLHYFTQAHAETDFLTTYADEGTHSVEDMEERLAAQKASRTEIEICAFVDGILVGSAGNHALSTREKLRHRADFGISILREYWGQGIGAALTGACIDCAKKAGFRQLELEVVGENETAVRLYKKYGFMEYGRNPRGFLTRDGRWQELVLMRLELEDVKAQKMMRGMERAMFFKEDTTFNDIRDKSLQQWLDEMEQHQDVVVRGGVKLTREYVQYLKDEIGRLRHENEVKNAYLKKLREKK